MGPITFTNLTRAVEIGANCYVIEIAGKRIVLDCGLHPKFDGEMAQPNLSLLADESVDAIVLSHAHQDHLGSLPVLMRRQSNAPVFMTEATKQLSELLPQLNELLRDRVDRLVVQFKESAPEFFNEYQSARVIVDPPTGSSLTAKTGAKQKSGTTPLDKAA